MPKPNSSSYTYHHYGISLKEYNDRLREKREALLRKHRLACVWCACYLNSKTLTIEHIIPLAQKGEHVLENMAPACFECNNERGDDLNWTPARMRFGECPRLDKEGKVIVRESVAA